MEHPLAMRAAAGFISDNGRCRPWPDGVGQAHVYQPGGGGADRTCEV